MDRYVAITAIILLGALGFPIPVPLAGLLATAGIFAAHGKFCVALLIALAAGGAILGDTLGYAAGRLSMHLYRRRGMALDARGSRPSDRLSSVVARVLASGVVRRAAGWCNGRLSQGGSMAILIVLSRTVLGLFGPVINILSGARRYPLSRFLLFDAIGEFIWVGAYVGVGFVAGMRGNAAGDLLRDPVAIVALGLLMIAPMAITARIKPARRPVRPS